MDVKVTDTPDAFDLPEWRELLAADPDRHVFATPEWCRVWWEEFGAGRRLLVLTFLDPGPVGLAPLMVEETAAGTHVAFLGDDDLTDYQGPVAAGHDRLPAIADALVRYVRDELPRWDVFEGHCLPVPFGFAEWLVEAADRLGLDFEIEQNEMTAVLAIPGSFDAYVEALPPKRRHELRRKMRRFDREVPGARLRTADAASLEADLGVFVDLHRGSEGLKGKFMAPERAGFFGRLARAFDPAGMLSLDFLDAGGRSLASTFSFRYDRTFYLYNSAYEHVWRAASPGLVLVARLIERCIGEGYGRFDFLRGRERYKFDLGADALPLHRVRIRRR